MADKKDEKLEDILDSLEKDLKNMQKEVFPYHLKVSGHVNRLYDLVDKENVSKEVMGIAKDIIKDLVDMYFTYHLKMKKEEKESILKNENYILDLGGHIFGIRAGQLADEIEKNLKDKNWNYFKEFSEKLLDRYNKESTQNLFDSYLSDAEKKDKLKQAVIKRHQQEGIKFRDEHILEDPNKLIEYATAIINGQHKLEGYVQSRSPYLTKG